MYTESTNICQSCGMPMPENAGLYGSNQDGTSNKEYCKYCFSNGTFGKPDETMTEMIETCIPFMVEKGMSREGAKLLLEASLPKLKRWKTS